MRTLPPIFVACALWVGAGFSPVARAGEPFLIQNDHPIGRLYGLPAGDDLAGVGATGFQARAAFDVANNSCESVRGGDELVFDGETWVARFAARQGWRNGWRLALLVPLVSHQGGGTDDFIENYHDALGLPDGNRKTRPAGRLEYRCAHVGRPGFDLEDSATGLGDVRISLGAPLWRNAATTRALDAVAGAELPTGDPDRLLGSGSWDFSFGLAAADAATLASWNLELHGEVGVLALTDGEVLEDFQEPFAGYGTVSVGWRLARWLVPRLQLDAHSPFFADTGWAALDDWGVALASGATVRLPGKFDLDVAVAEDVVVNTAPDVVFHVGLKRSL